jgi:hypothetical protein
MPPLKNLRQETFCQEYLKCQHAPTAYKNAGYKCGTANSMNVCASTQLKKTKIKARIMELERPGIELRRKADMKAAEQSIIDRSWVVGRLVQNVDRSMQAEPVLDKTGRPTGVYTYEGGVANRGLELIGKNLGMFQDKSPLEGLLTGASVTVSVYLPEKHQKPLIVGNGHDHGHTNGD